MKKHLPGPLATNARQLMRSAGYGEQTTREGQISYTRRLRGDRFPRLHAYVEDQGSGIQINLHLDQKEHGVGSGAVHGGEYEGPLLENEIARIVSLVRSGSAPSAPAQNRPEEPEEKGFWKSLFGG